jgi:hypothetical protein
MRAVRYWLLLFLIGSAPLGALANDRPVDSTSAEVWTLDQIIFPMPKKPSRLRQLEPTKSMNEVVEVLNRLDIKFDRKEVELNTTAMPAQVVEQIRPLTEPFVVPDGTNVTVSVVLSRRPISTLINPTTLDPSRVATARVLLDVVMPPAKRDGMIDSMMRGMMANLSQAMLGSPQMKAAFEADPRAGEIFQKFFQRQQANSLTALKANFPGMMEAMARAYARRFTVTQMGEMRTFFETPTGQVYIGQAATIVNDPDVAKWQRDLMTKEMGKMPAEIEAMMAEIKALPPKGKTGG